MSRKQSIHDLPNRRAPDLPPCLEDLVAVDADILCGGPPLEEFRVRDIDVSRQKIPALVAKNSLFDHVSFANSEISSSRFRDVRLVRCDFSNAVLRGFEALRVEFIDCRLVGMKAIECRWKDVLVESCDVRYAQLNDGHVQNCESEPATWASRTSGRPTSTGPAS